MNLMINNMNTPTTLLQQTNEVDVFSDACLVKTGINIKHKTIKQDC